MISSTLSLYFNTIELKCLECVYNYCIEHDIQDMVLCNDGVMIKKNDYFEGIKDEFKNVIKQKLGLDLQFKLKPFEYYTDEKIKEHTIIKEEDKEQEIKDFF